MVVLNSYKKAEREIVKSRKLRDVQNRTLSCCLRSKIYNTIMEELLFTWKHLHLNLPKNSVFGKMPCRVRHRRKSVLFLLFKLY